MSSSANRSWIAACRRRLAAALCVVMLLAGLLPAHAVAQDAPSGFCPTVAFVAQADEEAPVAADAVPGHAAGQCACKIAALPGAAVQRPSILVQPAMFAAARAHALRPGALAPPAEPPRI